MNHPISTTTATSFSFPRNRSSSSTTIVNQCDPNPNYNYHRAHKRPLLHQMTSTTNRWWCWYITTGTTIPTTRSRIVIIVQFVLGWIILYYFIITMSTFQWSINLHDGINNIIPLQQPWSSNGDDYALAKYESYGFFTDIDSATWYRHKQRAHDAIYEESLYYNKLYPNDQAYTNPAVWLMTNVQPFFTCPNLRRYGGHNDGAKWICDPHRFITQSDCLIYSFGSSGVYNFEDSIVSNSRRYNSNDGTTNTCEIHVFDPEPSYARINDPIYNNIHYHSFGLQSSQLHNEMILKKYKWLPQYKNIYEIIQYLKHDHRRIDIFKIDCEGCEWTTYMDWLFMSNSSSSTNITGTPSMVDIRQIVIETHGVPPSNSSPDNGGGGGGPSTFFNAMVQNHYVLFNKEANTHPGARPYGVYYEWSWLKLHPNFF